MLTIAILFTVLVVVWGNCAAIGVAMRARMPARPRRHERATAHPQSPGMPSVP